MLPTECGTCSCALWPEQLVDLDSFGDNGLRVEFDCHCGAETVCVVTEGQYAAWVSDQADAFAAVLDDWGVEGLFSFWNEQDVAAILVEVSVA